MAAPIYPSQFPCPLIDGFTIDVDSGLIRSKEGGLPAQRRVAPTMPHSFKCRFFLSIKFWGDWQEWMQNDGHQWFIIDLPSVYAGIAKEVTVPHLVRLMSPITIDARTYEHVIASATLELAPSMFKQMATAFVPTGNWIVAHSPGSPSAPNWFVAQTPAAPSIGSVWAGTPALPAA
jgi:hypothetical protein